METEFECQTTAAYDEKNPVRMTQRNGDRSLADPRGGGGLPNFASPSWGRGCAIPGLLEPRRISSRRSPP